MARQSIIDYQTVGRLRKPLFLLHVFGLLNLVLGACIFCWALPGLQYGGFGETLVVLLWVAPAIAAGLAQLRHRRTRWRFLIGLQCAVLSLPLLPLAMGSSGYLSGELEQVLPLVASVLLLWWLIPFLYLLQPRVRAALQ